MPNKWNPHVKSLPIKTDDGKNIVRLHYKGKFTRKEIVQRIQKQSKDFKKQGKNFEMQIVVRYPEKWYPGGFTKVGEPVKLFSYDLYKEDREDPKEYPEFRVYYYK